MDITKNSSAIMVLHWIISNGAIQTLKRWEQENFFPKKGEILNLEILPENLYHPVNFHGEYKVPSRVVQTLTVWTPSGKLAVGYKF